MTVQRGQMALKWISIILAYKKHAEGSDHRALQHTVF